MKPKIKQFFFLFFVEVKFVFEVKERETKLMSCQHCKTEKYFCFEKNII
jgi:hypothetical protein